MGLIAITGARGFLGRATIHAALRAGHDVIALTRKPSGTPLPEEVEEIPLDLADPNAPLADALAGCDAVIHAASAMSGDAALWRRDTVQATANLLSALKHVEPRPRLVLVSSIAVYDATAPRIDEDTPLEARPATRDGYTRSKLAQEALLDGYDGDVWIARPGAIFGPGRIWNAHVGPRLGPLLIRLGNRGEIPLVGLATTASALVTMAETRPPEQVRPVNLVAGDLPDRRRFLAALGRARPRVILPLPWRVLMLPARLLSLLPGLGRYLPGLLRPRVLAFRMAPKSYSAERARSELNWADDQPFENAVRAALEGRA